MRNIHLIATDKPSRLYYNNKTLILDSIEDKCYVEETKNQHIYITSDEEIKDGDWYIHKQINYLRVSNSTAIPMDAKKIILTDNKDLIKDGVQAIDDEFLEWFVKNPSCEFVKVIGELDEVDPQIYVDYSYNYKIIIPKQEANYNMKEEIIDEMKRIEKPKHIPYKGKIWEPPKQETIEEASKRAVKSGLFKDETLFIAGAKWQEQQNNKFYSEEDMRKAFKASSLTNMLDVYESFEEFIEQFKNK
jgi:hypothetical protein